MKQIVVISGKGGTGKTSISSSFAALAKNPLLIDCDVDAADMYILLKIKNKEVENDFYGGEYAFIKKESCISCGKCIEVCRFDAVSSIFEIDPSACEGCKFCLNVCPVNAIEMKDKYSGKWFVSSTEYGPLVHARLEPGEDNSGKLVTKIKQEGVKLAEKQNKDLIIIDGPPGTGCPLMASCAEADIAVIITEPTCSGIHDMKRVIETISSFSIKTGVIINKWDINEKESKEIENLIKEKNIPLLGKISFDRDFEKSIMKEVPPVNYGNKKIEKEIKDIWEKTLKLTE